MSIKRNCIFAVLALLMISSCGQYEKVKDDLSFLMPDKFQCTVMQVNSGDRFLCELSGLDIENIKLIGIEIPRDKEQEAKQYTKSILRRGTLIEIEPGKDSRDNQGNIPAYVYVTGGRMLNLMLAEKGYAEINLDEITKYEAQYQVIQEKIEVEVIDEK